MFILFQSMRTALVLHKMDFDVENRQQVLFMEQFSLQLLNQKIHFTAFGFFTIDYSLLFTIIAAITTYLIVLIQFHINYDASKQ